MITFQFSKLARSYITSAVGCFNTSNTRQKHRTSVAKHVTACKYGVRFTKVTEMCQCNKQKCTAEHYRKCAFVRFCKKICLTSILIISAHQHLVLLSGLFPSGFSAKTLYVSLLLPLRSYFLSLSLILSLSHSQSI
jgi:hypothetical protein